MIITTCCNCDRTADADRICVECQGAVCPRCAQFEDGDLWCPGCLETAAEHEIDPSARGQA